MTDAIIEQNIAKKNVVKVIETVAKSNTPSVCRKYYIPSAFTHEREGAQTRLNDFNAWEIGDFVI